MKVFNTLSGKKACLGAFLSWSWKERMDAWIELKDADAAAAAAREAAHKTTPVVTVQ